MENILLVNTILLGIVFGAVAMLAIRGGTNFSSKTAAIRVRADDRDRRRVPEAQDKEYDPSAPTMLLALAALVLLLIMVINIG
jgi:hypothetical protein